MAVTFGKRAPVVALVGIIVTAGLGLGLGRLKFATGQDSYLNKSQQVFKDNRAYQSLFGGDAMVVLFTANAGKDISNLFDSANRATMQSTEQTLRQSGLLASLVGPDTALEFTHALVLPPPGGGPTDSVAGKILLSALSRDSDPASKQARLTDGGVTLARAAAAGNPSFANREWVRFLLFDNFGFSMVGGKLVAPPAGQMHIRTALLPFFPDLHHAQMIVRLHGNASIDIEGKASDTVVATVRAQHFDGFTTLTTGSPVLLKNINDYLQGGFLTLGGIAVVVMAAILLVLFAVRWRLLPLPVVIIGVAWAFGVFGFLGIPLSLVTISGLPILIGVGIDFAIQMHSRIEEEVVIDRAVHPIAETTVNLAPALLTATGATVFAFAALQLSRVPMIRQFGVLLAVGIFVICIGSLVLPTAFLGRREFLSRTTTGDYQRGALGRLVVRLGSLPQAAVVPLIVASVVILAAGVAVEPKLKLQTDPEKWVNQHSEVVKNIRALQQQVGSSSELGIYVQTPDVFSDNVVRFVDGFARQELAKYPHDLLTGSSIVTTVSSLIDLPSPPPGIQPLPLTGADVKAAFGVAPRDIQVSTVSAGGKALNIIFDTGPAPLQHRKIYVDDIRTSVRPPPGVSATPSGLAVVGVGLLANLEANRTALIYVALGLVFAFLLLCFRSPVKALLSVVPVLIAVGASSLVEYAAGFQLSPLTAVGGPLVIAACTEFTVLILLRYLEERDRGEDPKEAVDVAAARTGRAFVCSALTAIAGIGVLALSSLPLLRDFGVIVALNVAIALLSALVVLPPLLVWADTRGWLRRTHPYHREPVFD